MKVLVGSYSAQGKRERQEDAVIAIASEREPVAFLSVADGMGGHARGDEAAQAAVDRASRNWWSSALAFPALPVLVVAHMAKCEEAVAKLVGEKWYIPDEQVARKGPGSTLTAAWVHNGRFAFGHVGDSRLYHWQVDGTLKQLTRRHGYRHILTQALGNWDRRKADDYEWQTQPDGSRTHFDVGSDAAEPGSALLLTTDGVHETLSDDQIAKILRVAMSGGMAPDKICTHLVNAALQAGSDDNCTAAIAYFPPD